MDDAIPIKNIKNFQLKHDLGIETIAKSNLEERRSFSLSARSCLFSAGRFNFSFRFPVTLIRAITTSTSLLRIIIFEIFFNNIWFFFLFKIKMYYILLKELTSQKTLKISKIALNINRKIKNPLKM